MWVEWRCLLLFPDACTVLFSVYIGAGQCWQADILVA